MIGRYEKLKALPIKELFRVRDASKIVMDNQQTLLPAEVLEDLVNLYNTVNQVIAEKAESQFI